MSTEPVHQPSSMCDHSLLNNEVSSVPSSVANNQQTLSLATNNRPSNFEFLTNVVGNSASGDVRYSQSDKTVNVVTYSSERHPENYEVNVNYSTSPNTRVRSALQLSPVPHFLSNPPPQQSRSYTSVNLTLRPPSSEPQPPIDIRSAGSSLTYSTCSYDPRQGFQSQLQIRIGPGGMGSVSAVRTHVPPPPHIYHLPLPLRHHHQLKEEEEEAERTELEASQPHTQVLLRQQLERKNKLQRELCKEKENLRAMQQEVQEMKKDLEQRQRRKQILSLPMVSTVMQKVQELRAEILRLQEECKKMTQEVDHNLDARVPLGETNEEFYKNIYTGQRGFILPPSSQPPSQRPDPGPGPGRGVQSGEPSEGPHWTCSQCTFRNHPLLDKCETCEMPRIMLAGGEMQDIHIHVTHHNFPARRVIHSWVV